jgi:hypothetical protein
MTWVLTHPRNLVSRSATDGLFSIARELAFRDRIWFGVGVLRRPASGQFWIQEAEGWDEAGGGGFAFKGLRATAEACTFGDNKLLGPNISKKLSLVTDFDRFRGGNVPMHLAVKDYLIGLDIALEDGIRAEHEGSTRDDFTLKVAVKFKIPVEREGAFQLNLIGDDGPALMIGFGGR